MMIWKGCLTAMQRLPSPVGNGWELSEGVVKPVLMIKEAAQEGLAELAVCKCDTSSCKSNLHCLCRMNEMPCTEASGCMADENCQNPHNTDNANDSSDDEI